MDELNKLQAEAESRMQYKPVETMTMADAMREKLNGIEQVEPKSFGESNAYKKYFSTKQDILEEAKTINKATGIPINAIIDGNVEKAREIYDYQRKQLDPEEVYKTYPGLKRLAELDENEAAIALHDLKSVKKTHDVFEAAKVGYQTQSLDYEKRTIGLKAFEGTFTDEDRKRVAEIDAELNTLKEIPDLMEAPGQNIVGSLTQQVPMMARQLLKGQVLGLAGAVAGGAIGAVGGGIISGGSASPALGLQGMRIGYSVGSRIGFATEMFKESVGGYYLDYIGYKDKKGNQLLTDGEARVYATVTALAETGIEMANFGKVLEILKGNKATVPAAKVIENIVKNSKDAASIQAQLKTWLSTNMKNIGIVVATESAEEGAQRMSEMGITQIARVNNPEGDVPVYNATDIVKGGLEASYQALGASIGLGGLATGASGLRFTRHATQLLSLGKERADEALRTQTGVNLLNNLMEAAQDTELGANHKETFNKLMKSNLEGTVHETAYVDSELLLAEEGGDVVFNQLAAAAGYTEEQINTLRETGAPIEINTADVVSTIAGASEINIADYVSFDAADRCFARNQKVAKELDNFLKKIKTEEVDRVVNNINTLATEMFGETEERDLATMIIAEFEDPIAGIEERRKEINQEIDEMINPVVEKMRGGMGQGVELYETDDYGNVLDKGDHDSHVGGAVRLSNNDPWYTKYYKANKKRSSEKELRELAEEVITGNNEYGVGDYDYSDPTMVEYGEENKARLDNLRHELELLANIEPKLKDVNKGDFAALDGLSEDGVKVYKAMYDVFRNAPSKKWQRSASMNALIYAHRAETWAAEERIVRNKKASPLEYLKRVRVEFGGEAVKGALGQSDTYGVSKDVFEKQKEAVKRKYLNTEQWLKAPNGEDTNLTEEQWLIVRTPAFKNWFGNWDYNPYQAIQFVDLTDVVPRDKDGNIVNIKNTKELNKWVAETLNDKIVEVDDVGTIISFTKTGIKDGVTKATIRKDQDPIKRNLYAKIEQLIKESIYFNYRQQDERHTRNSKGQEFYVNGVKVNTENGTVYYRVEFIINLNKQFGRNYKGHKTYKIKIEPIVYRADVGQTPVLGARSRLHSQSSPIVSPILSDLVGEVNLDHSKVLDENGEPLVVYHGTEEDFDVFDRTKSRANMDIQGNFFSPWEIDAQGYGSNVRAFWLNIRNPASSSVGYKALNMFKGQNGAGIKAREYLIKQGYDGVNNDDEEYIAFDSEQIKSVDNQGTFDADNPNIFYQAAGQNALTANQEALQEAMSLKENGEDAKTIYEKTGWYLGADGKWRFEIPDNLDKIKYEKISKAGQSMSLGELYDNPVLYAAYPWLKETMVEVIGRDKTYYGMADGKNIYINEKLIDKVDKEVLYIGGESYGRIVGEDWQVGNAKQELTQDEQRALMSVYAENWDFDAAIAKSEANLSHIEEIKKASKPGDRFAAIREKQIEAITKQLEILKGFKAKGARVEKYTSYNREKTREQIGKTLFHEIQHLIQDREGFAMGGNPEQVNEQISRQKTHYEKQIYAIHPKGWMYAITFRDMEKALLNGDVTTAKKLEGWIAADYAHIPDDARQEIIKIARKIWELDNRVAKSRGDFERYQNLHGEQEARAASEKAEISTLVERANAETYSTDELVAKFGGDIKDKDKLARWQELRKSWAGESDVKWFKENYDEMDALRKELETTVEGIRFFEKVEANDEADFYKFLLEDNVRDLQRKVLNGINPYNAIVVFGGDIISGYVAGPKGQTVLKSTGERVIKLFESADESTFIHEIAHVAYEDLRELASYANAPAQFKRDIKTLDDWANWKDGQLKEYEGTSTYKEFAQRDAAIREALANNDIATAEQLKYEWRQERFARGFEEYLKKGKAPTEGLRKVFYQFKTWLTKIYRAYRGIGGVPTKEVEAVMTRLLLTEEAIELAEKKSEIDAFEKSGVFNYLGDNAKAMWQKILEDVRKDATSKVLKIAMKDMSDLAKKERQEKIDAERQAAYERMAKEPVWAVHAYLKYNPKMDTVAACKLFGLTVEEYVGLLRANGGTLDKAVDNYMKVYEAELEAPKKADIEARAEEAMATSYYKTLLSAFETEILQREVRREARLSKKLAGIVTKDETERAEIEKSLRELDKKGDEARWQRAVRDVAKGNADTIKQYAKSKLALLTIDYSAKPRVWENAARQKAAEMADALAKKNYQRALNASKMRLVNNAMADVATENKHFIDRKVKEMKNRAKTIRREKNMGANDRYVYNHLLYAFGLAERDVPRPPQFTSFNEVLISYDSTLSMPFIGDNGELLISDFIINAGTGTGKAVKGIHELTVSEFTELANVMDNIYTVAVEANKIKTVTTTEGETITVDQALAEITDDAFNRHKEKEVVDTTMAGNVKKMDDVLNTANRIHISLLKAETILGELSDKAVKYIYDPIKRAAEKELKMTIEFGEKIEAIRQAWLDGKVEKYLNQGLGEDEARKAAEKEIEEAFSVERYKLGTSNITKENIIAFALNWGTEINRKRAMNYPGTTTRDYERIFAEMDGADWQFVTNVWDLFEETWPQLKQVEANVSGVTLEKQEGITFNVTGKDGANYIIQGKYYPIKYDPKKNQKVQRQQKEEGVRTNLPSMARMGVGIGMTKERAVSTSYLMRNDLGVFAEAIQENIHLICMREAVRDASRLINDERFADTIKRTLGGNALSALQDWVLDCWQLEPKVKNDFESAMAYLRRKQTTAVLAFRLSTALLNVANIGPVMHYLGMGRTKKALMDFYAHPIEQYNFVIERSPFVKNRAQTMDRDIRDVVKGKGIGDKMNKLEAMGFYMITKTDLMLACPLWLSEYQRVYRENAEQLSAEQIERMAVDAGDKAVRSVFGSGMVQDLAAVQRGGEVTKMLTMYYSYFSVVQQAISKSAFEYNRSKVNGDDWYKRWAPVANTIILWLIIPSAISAIIKMGIEAATGDDDDEITFENFIKRTGADTINAAAGGVPILRDVVNVAMAYAVEGKYYGARSTSIGETTEKMMDVIRSIKGFADDKKDLDDVLRAVFRATAYTTGIPVAGADALSTLYQWIAYGDATPEEIREYLTAILFDKKVKK